MVCVAFRRVYMCGLLTGNCCRLCVAFWTGNCCPGMRALLPGMCGLLPGMANGCCRVQYTHGRAGRPEGAAGGGRTCERVTERSLPSLANLGFWYLRAGGGGADGWR